MLKIFTIVTILACAQAQPAAAEVHQGSSYLHFNILGKIADHGYYGESHTVQTSDGYILEMNRIPFGKNEPRGDTKNVGKPVVFLMHGLQGAAVAYVSLGPGEALAYLLAEEGYDVWMGNARGVLNSRRHVTLNPDDPSHVKDFFDYSFDNIGTKDLPAMIDYILDFTKQPQLHYVGHSQGGTIFLVMNSLLPEYNNKIKSAHLLAGVGYQRHFPNTILTLAAISANPLYAFAVRMGLIELLGPDWNEDAVGECSDNNQEACSFSSIREVMNDLLGDQVLAGASIKQYAHYGQNINDKRFRRWYYNPLTNLMKYGSISPPEYNIGRITIDTTMHYTVNDELLDERDVLDMVAAMPNTKARKVARETYTHTDFVVARDSKELVYDFIIDALNKHK